MTERKYIDLHVHSIASDGTLTPTQVVQAADDAGLYAFALTDHDCITGLTEAIEASRDLQVHVIPGIEITTAFHGEDAHILGLYIDKDNAFLVRKCDHLQEVRTERNWKIIRKMNELGFEIDGDAFMKEHAHTSITRMHYAKYMAMKGYVKEPQDAFKTYLGTGGPLNIPREKITVPDAVEMILAAGGIPILAHPVLYKWHTEHLMPYMKELKEMGIRGVEAIYSRNKPGDEEVFREAAKKLDWVITGGSDFHGENKPDIQIGVGCGNLRISKELLTALKH